MKNLIFTSCTVSQFNELPSYRWVSLPKGNELKIGGSTVAIKLRGEYSYRMFKNAKEAHAIFESFLSQLRCSN